MSALVAALTLTCLGRAYAAIGIGVSPGKFDAELDPGESIEGVLNVSNDGDTPLQIRSHAADRTLQGDGGIQYSAPGSRLDSPAAWFQIEPAGFSLDPSNEEIVRWRLSVPPDAIPGDYVGVLFFETIPEARPGAVSVGGRVGSVATVRVRGATVLSGRMVGLQVPVPPAVVSLPIPRRRPLSLSWSAPLPLLERGPVSLIALFENDGTVRLPIDGEITIMDVFGRTVAELKPQEPLNLYPRDTDGLKFTWEGVPAFGRFVATGRFVMGDESVTSSAVFYTFPVRRAVSLLLLIAGALLLASSRRIRMKNRGTPASAPVEPAHCEESEPGSLPPRRGRKRRG